MNKIRCNNYQHPLKLIAVFLFLFFFNYGTSQAMDSVAFEIFEFQNQDLEVQGKIRDGNGIPLPGATIIEKGTSNGVQSDFDGNFSLEVSNGDAILVISYLGFRTQEVA